MRWILEKVVLGLIIIIGFSAVQTEALTVGETAPDFILPNEKGEDVKLTDFQGNYVVLYFYPKDHTPGCTTEACEFRDHHQSFQDLNAVIIGISQDSVKSHAGFSEKHGLPFTILADESGKVVKAYNAQAGFPLSWFGLGTARKTYVIDPQGKIMKVYQNVDVNQHVEDVLEALRRSRNLSQ